MSAARMTMLRIVQSDYSEKWPVTSMPYESLHRWKEGGR